MGFSRYRKSRIGPLIWDSSPMPCLSIQYNPKIGPIIQVLVWKPGFAPPQGTGAAPMQASTYNALIDTGASCSCVSDKVIKTEGLVPSGKQQVSGLHGSRPTNAYRFQLVIPFIQSQHVGGQVTANVLLFNINGIEFVPMPNIDVLVGRDILCTGTFTMAFDGHATLSL
ncbi:MAG: aspartyl protease family protein [Methylocella sp.]